MPKLLRLTLQDFRNYQRLDWRLAPEDQDRILVITGPNGSGKTNLLEALSLLVPGRGLRAAPARDYPHRHDGQTAPAWSVAARFHTAQGTLEIGTGLREGATTDRRQFLLDGESPRSAAEITARLAMVWLTPQMDALFQQPPSGRRRFLDRLVAALDPDHGRQIAAHDNAASQRLRLLAAPAPDQAWLAGLEDSIARHAVAATAARARLATLLNQALANGAAAGFPPAELLLLCPIADRLRAGSALAVEEWLRACLASARPQDAASGSTSYGAQRTDMDLRDRQTGREASLASTGQQKALLIGVILGHAALIGQTSGAPPVLLLDEPLVHLDEDRRAMLCAALPRLGAPVLVTGTDAAAFAPLGASASWFETKEGQGLRPRTPTGA